MTKVKTIIYSHLNDLSNGMDGVNSLRPLFIKKLLDLYPDTNAYVSDEELTIIWDEVLVAAGVGL